MTINTDVVFNLEFKSYFIKNEIIFYIMLNALLKLQVKYKNGI
jgi:hypothetical protein